MAYHIYASNTIYNILQISPRLWGSSISLWLKRQLFHYAKILQQYLVYGTVKSSKIDNSKSPKKEINIAMDGYFCHMFGCKISSLSLELTIFIQYWQ